MVAAFAISLAVLSASSTFASPTAHRPGPVGHKRTTIFPVTFTLSAPSSAPTLARSLVSFSIEGDRWPDWAGTSSANQLFVNCLNNLGKLTGKQPDVRVGANSADRTTYDSSVDIIDATFPASSSTTPYPEASSVEVSSGYYQLSKYMPSGTHMVWGVNLGATSTSNAVAEAQAIMSTFSSGGAANSAGVLLDSIEIGNEADLYTSNNGLRDSSWNLAAYVTQWETFASDIISTLGLTAGVAPWILAGSFAESTHSSTGFSPQGLIAKGVLSSSVGSHINTFSQHHYSGSFCSGSGGLLSSLMDKTSIRSNISQFDADISAATAQGLTYVLGETNSYSCHGAPGVSDTAGAAIWTLDYVLQAATHAVRRVYFHNGVGFKYNMLQPVTLTRSIDTGATLSTPLTPHVQPQYYAAIIAAKFIGSSSSATAISEVTINNGNVGGYQAYEGGKLVRAVLINNKAYLTSTTGSRGYSTLQFSFSGSATAPTSIQVRRLTIGHADDTSGLTFAGQSYETSTGLVSGTESYTTVSVSNTLALSDTEVALLTFVY
ncbi:hypothetical protein DL93DRAFT_2056457 [Clavulina sp. PMI_390]|nr:hypothetical protein DL93DRAFT_2056457 [Clavulina sp. PMI_390]